MQLPKLKVKNLHYLLPVLVWLLIFTAPVFLGEHRDGVNWSHIFRIWRENSIILIIFLLNRFILLPKLFFQNRKLTYLLSVVSIIFLISLAFYIQNKPPKPVNHVRIHGDIEPPKPFIPPPPRKSGIPPFANFFIMSILIIGFDTGLVFYTKWMEAEKNKLQAEKESIRNKMAFLQSQISPHFFMNTLNNIHALIDINTNQAKKAIVQLSRLMDYMLYESNVDKVTLKKETEFVKSYIELMKLRFTKNVDIQLSLPATIPSVKIPPLLTIPFIENAFKHGVSYQRPSFIYIIFQIKDNRLLFIVQNSIAKQQKRQGPSGIGLKNVQHRLDALYGKDYILDITNKDDVFQVILEVPL